MITASSSRRFGIDRQRLRAWSAVLCALFVFTQLASFAHEALNAHAVCAEHGELIHVARVTSVPTASNFASRHALAPRVRPTAPRNASEHEHCGLATLSRQRSLQLDDGARVVVAHASAAAPSLVAVTEDHTPIPLLLLAPKQSPPL